MQGNRRRDTTPELAVRRLVHRAGLRYRVDTRPIPTLNRRADLVFSRARVAVFIDGCFWHGCPAHGSIPRTNSAYWHPRIQGNVARDADTVARLQAGGWTVVRIWEHEDPVVAAGKILAVVLAAQRPQEGHAPP
ncbi:very short patch repair endonuclease [Nocardioides sp. zg-1230]|uniref:very short patch repair endonuclease n=1 Tax=Nocardioides sp. zg-1230 TaxID=2736601 RepID=UPI0015545C6C|nr:very short patch repair endonuclease [Nocardioides sp. zg-1230]NPC41054.1 very short patch repair endonuclease [Nocardioides sp. zg-1230]